MAQNPELPRNAVQADVRSINNKAQALARSLDEIVWAVKPENDTLDHFISYVCYFVQNYLQLASIRCRLAVPTRLPDIPLTSAARHNIFMTLKEALNNVVKHANASEVRIQIVIESAQFVITINDDGKGFRYGPVKNRNVGPTAESLGRGAKGNGLSNMRKRMQNVGGELRLQSQLNQGTQIELIVPLRK